MFLKGRGEKTFFLSEVIDVVYERCYGLSVEGKRNLNSFFWPGLTLSLLKVIIVLASEIFLPSQLFTVLGINTTAIVTTHLTPPLHNPRVLSAEREVELLS